ARNETPLVRQPACVPVLQRHLQRRLHGLRATAAVKDVAESLTELAEDQLCELLERIGGEQIPVRAGNLLELRGDSGIHLAVRMADAEGSGTTRTVQIAAAARIKQVTTLAADDPWQPLEPETDGAIRCHDQNSTRVRAAARASRCPVRRHSTCRAHRERSPSRPSLAPTAPPTSRTSQTPDTPQ